VIREFSADELVFLLLAVRWTVLLTVVAFVGGGAVGLAIAILRVSEARLRRAAAIAYIKLFQGTPLLMQLYLVYFGANLFGFEANAWTAAAIGLTLYSSAFLGEIWRGCIQAVPQVQWEAARALALGRMLQLRLVILPQALRVVVPPLMNQYANIVKNSSYGAVVAYPELVQVFMGTTLSQTGHAIEIAVITVAVYLGINLAVSLAMNRYNRRIALVTR
jgi:polar amino acid transport system permease protein